MRSIRTIVSLIAVFVLVAAYADAQKRRKNRNGEEEEITQTLEVIPDPPGAIAAEPQRLSFFTVPMSSKGLLSQQVRDGVKTLRKMVRGAQIVKVRAFVAGTGDLRRVPTIVSEVFSDAKQQVPAVTAIQVGALPQVGAQVWLEAIAQEKKPASPNGIAFLSGQPAAAQVAMEKVLPLVEQSSAKLETALKGIHAEPAGVLRVTCFASSLSDYEQVRLHLARQFPSAALTIVQPLRGLSTGMVECEAVARLDAAPAKPLELVNPAGLDPSPHYSHAALVNAPKVIISGTQMAFNGREEDIRLAFERLSKTIEQSGGAIANTAMMNYYPLSQSTIDKVRNVRTGFLDKTRMPASTMVLFEGLPSLDASFAVEAVTLP